MIIDVKYNGKKIYIIHDNYVEEIEPIYPYFYIFVHKSSNIEIIRRCLIENIVDIEETNLIPIVSKSLNRYDIDNNYRVYKVICKKPSDVPEIASKFLMNKYKCSAFNVKYLARVSFDLDLDFFDINPLYYGFDFNIIENIRKLKVLVIDVEAINYKPILASLYEYTPFEEIRKDDIIHLKLPDQIDELQKYFDKYTIISGHNILGFDIPLLKKNDVYIDSDRKSFVDTSAILASWGQSFQIGSARSLLDVSKALKDKVGINDQEIEIKERSRGRISKMSFDELVRYNVNDVVLTSKLLNLIFTFLAIMSGLTQIPISVVQSTTAGVIAEYFLLHDMELKGLVPEYRSVNWRASAHKVYIYKENYITNRILKYDVKMMYPTFVLKHHIDPTLTVNDAGVQEGIEYKLEHNVDTKIKFDIKSGLGLIYSTIIKLYKVRQMTKKLKKENQLFENVDLAVKALINALAYGVQGKKSGYSILGNVVCPVKIFLGTTRCTLGLIEYLKSKGYKVVYSDTDSVFVEDKGYDPNQLLIEINNFLSKYGLEVDYEGNYDQAYIIDKKTYILIGNDIVIKGGKIKTKLKFFLPQIIAKNFIKIIKEYPYNHKKLIRELIDSCDVEELFSAPSQQLWRLISKDLTSAKRDEKEGKEVVKVRTVWDTIRIIYLKKGRPEHFALPSHAPLITLLTLSENFRIMLHDYEPYFIIDSLCMYIPTYANIKLNIDVWKHENVRCLYYLNGDVYVIGIRDIRYILEDKYGEILRIPTHRINSNYNFYTITGVEADLKIKKLNVSEEFLRNLAYKLAVLHIEKIFESVK